MVTIGNIAAGRELAVARAISPLRYLSAARVMEGRPLGDQAAEVVKAVKVVALVAALAVALVAAGLAAETVERCEPATLTSGVPGGLRGTRGKILRMSERD